MRKKFPDILNPKFISIKKKKLNRLNLLNIIKMYAF